MPLKKGPKISSYIHAYLIVAKNEFILLFALFILKI